MRAQEFVTERKKSREDFEGMTIEMVENGHVLVINALDDWGNNVLGSVAFNIHDNNVLDPQDLKVDERYQGQGIARAMYDYAKSKGYKIHRSYDQTDAGAGFWNKHRGKDVRVWEAFDKPYKGKWEKSDYGDVDMLAKLPDGTNLSIMFNQEYGDEGEEVVQVEFYRNNSQEVTGEGDAQRIFATVLDAIQKYIKKYKPQRLSFSASKAVDMDADDNGTQFNPESRAKLYDRLVQRYSKALGYRAFRADNGDIVIYELSRIKQGVTESKQPGKSVTDAIQKVLPIAQEIWFHGSRATGSHRRNSDTDILVVIPDDLVGDQYLAVVRILQKLASHFDNYDIQPTKSGTNIHRIAQEEGRLLWSSKQGVAEEQLDELSFLGSECTKDCSGHRAGYDWSKRKGLRQANSWSPSFNKGAGLAVAGK